MPKAPKGDVVKRWAPLLRAVRLNERKLGGVAPFREALERAYSEALFNQRAVDGALASLKQALRRRNKSLEQGLRCSHLSPQLHQERARDAVGRAASVRDETPGPAVPDRQEAGRRFRAAEPALMV